MGSWGYDPGGINYLMVWSSVGFYEDSSEISITHPTVNQRNAATEDRFCCIEMKGERVL
jgi:hypothetical protein